MALAEHFEPKIDKGHKISTPITIFMKHKKTLYFWHFFRRVHRESVECVRLFWIQSHRSTRRKVREGEGERE